MKLLEGKTKEEKTKIIIALVLGLLALLAFVNLIFAPFSGRKSTTASSSPSPSASATTRKTGDAPVAALPKQDEIDSVYCCVPVNVVYPPGANDAGRNIFAFYEPPIPTPWSPPPPTEPPTPKPIPPSPVPTPNIILSGINKQSVFAGENGFRLEVTGSGFTPQTPIWFGGTPLPTNFINPTQMSADVPTNYLATGRQANVEVRSADGKLFSNGVLFNIQQAPLPQFQYLGIVSRRRGNNDTAYIMEQGKTVPSSVRLNDIIGGRFRLISIAPSRLQVQDISLTFLKPYSIELVKGAGSTASNPQNPGGFNTPQNPGGFSNPNFPGQPQTFPPQNCPPGIPCDKLRPYNPQQPNQNPKDVDDNDDTDQDQ